VSLSERRRTTVATSYREKFRGEEPVVEPGIAMRECQRVYPIVSDIPSCSSDEAFDEA